MRVGKEMECRCKDVKMDGRKMVNDFNKSCKSVRTARLLKIANTAINSHTYLCFTSLAQSHS